MTIKRTLLLLALVVGAHVVLAQESTRPPDNVWSLRECIDYALAHNLDIRRSQLAYEQSAIDRRQAILSRFPTANAFSSYGYNWGRGLDPVTNQFVSSQRNSYTSVGASSDVILFNGFRIQNTIKQARKENEASQEDLQRAKNDVTLNVISLFVNVVFNKELVNNAQYQLASSQQQLERTRKLVAAGSLPKADELNLEAQVATNEVNLINQENALNLSLLELQQALQLPASGDFDVDVPELQPEDLVLEQTRAEIFDIARSTMPEIRSSHLRIESSYYGVKAARGNLFPRLSASGSINSNYSSSSATRFVPDGTFQVVETGYFVQGSNMPVYGYEPVGSFRDIYGFRDQIKDNLYKSVSVTLSIPIFNGLNARSAMQRAMIANEQARINAQETENFLRQTVETSYNNALAAAKAFTASTRQVAAREEAYRMAKQRFDIGAANYVDYQVAENELFQARTELARAKYEFIFRKKVLDFYLGKDLEF